MLCYARHAVLNTALSVAITHNVAAPSAVPRMLPLAAELAPAFAARVQGRLFAAVGEKRRREPAQDHERGNIA